MSMSTVERLSSKTKSRWVKERKAQHKKRPRRTRYTEMGKGVKQWSLRTKGLRKIQMPKWHVRMIDRSD